MKKGLKRLIKDLHKAEDALALCIYNQTVVPFMKRYKLTIDYSMGCVDFYKADGTDWDPYTGIYYGKKSVERLNVKVNSLCKDIDFLTSDKLTSLYMLVTCVNPNKEKMYARR